MRLTTRAVAATAIAAAAALPATAVAAPTQTFDAGAELVSQPKGQPWTINLVIGGTFGTDDGSPVKPVRKMRMAFPQGAKMNADLFGTCTAAQADKGNCSTKSKLGSGTAQALLSGQPIDAKLTVYNGPGTAAKRQVFMYVQALSTVKLALKGTLRKTGGAYGYVLDVDVPPIVPELEPGGIAMQNFSVKVGGSATRRGKKVPLTQAPARCSGSWKFQATFTYDDGAATVSPAIPCTLKAS